MISTFENAEDPPVHMRCHIPFRIARKIRGKSENGKLLAIFGFGGTGISNLFSFPLLTEFSGLEYLGFFDLVSCICARNSKLYVFSSLPPICAITVDEYSLFTRYYRCNSRIVVFKNTVPSSEFSEVIHAYVSSWLYLYYLFVRF